MLLHCGPHGQGGNGGHAHNDQLGIVLYVDGVAWLQDPGTYIYTALPSRRNEYRSVKAHFVPRVLDEPAPLDDIFHLADVGAVCLHVSTRGFYGRYRFKEGWVSRMITFVEEGIFIEDGVTEGLQLDAQQYPPTLPPLSPKYGSRLYA